MGADDLEPVTGAALEGLGDAAYLELDFLTSVAFHERAYAAYRAEGDGMGTIRSARMLAFLYGGVLGDGAVMQGWLARAQTLLNDVGDCAERGWVELTNGMFESRRATRNDRFAAAIDAARRFDDRDLELNAMAYLGASYVHEDRTEEGMRLLDEALAAVAGGEVHYFGSIEEIFCQLFSACEYAHDVVRADQWIRVGSEIARRRNLPAVSAFCRTHYGGILTVAGRWSEADAELTEAARIWGLGYDSLRWQALVRLAELRVRQGRVDDAERLLKDLDVYVEAARPLAGLHLARGDLALAADVLLRAIPETEGATAAMLWALLADVRIAQGWIDDARTAVEQLETIASRHAAHHVKAAAALARGRLCRASGGDGGAACLRDALSGFARAQMPLELARVRLELAHTLASDAPEVAAAEAKAALDAFERLEASRFADEAAAVLRSLGGPARTGPKGTDVLTKREAEVFELLGRGLSNPEIGDKLYITRKTVEHHVGSILAKLGLRNRAEAAAHAARSPNGLSRPDR